MTPREHVTTDMLKTQTPTHKKKNTFLRADFFDVRYHNIGNLFIPQRITADNVILKL